MKKSPYLWLPLAAFFLFSCLDAQAQLNVGIRGGVNFANFGPENVISFKARTRANFAVMFNVPVSPLLSIQIEPGFSQRGAKYDISSVLMSTGISMKSESYGKISANYIELPLLFQYRPKIGKLEGILSLGPELRFRAGEATVDFVDRQYQEGVLIAERSEKLSLSANDNFHDFDYGLAGGAGIAYPMRTFKIFTEARYHLGLRKLYVEGVDMYNRGASVHVGVTIPVRR
ncbi:porin family protein [Dyadobacter bucti]|uniref:porin family protein n=1 Tax=Dyadobacter bucti TaxID=2572203 RepID=UPI003F7044D1